ncbi:MAG: nucleotidyltransferase family protein, partial [Lachnospiraceae bacterium]|nr:nucleotidyltransferase family protein [Lachnospiraceae bacterium]
MKELSLLHQYVLRPIGALFLNASYSLPGSLSDDDAKKVYRMARQNDLAPITDYILETQGILTPESPGFPAFQKARRLSVFRTEGQQYLLRTAGKILSSRKIPYVPLKGAVIRSLYPEPWMRTSCDVDVLVKPEDFQRAVIALQEEAGVTETSKTEHDVSLGFSNGEKVELHFTLIEESKIMRAAKTLKDVWPVVEFGTEDPYEGTLPDDVFYYYHIAHLAKHFEIDGCGIRPVLDAWLLNRLPAFDKAKRDALLERGGLKRFADCVEKLGRYWFEGEEADETVLELERFILAGRSEG